MPKKFKTCSVPDALRPVYHDLPDDRAQHERIPWDWKSESNRSLPLPDHRHLGQLLLRPLGHVHVLRLNAQVRTAKPSPVQKEVQLAQSDRHLDQHSGFCHGLHRQVRDHLMHAAKHQLIGDGLRDQEHFVPFWITPSGFNLFQTLHNRWYSSVRPWDTCSVEHFRRRRSGSLSVWPYLEKFCHFGTIFKVLGKFVRVNLVFCKMLILLRQKNAIGQVLIVRDSYIL